MMGANLIYGTSLLKLSREERAMQHAFNVTTKDGRVTPCRAGPLPACPTV